MIDPSLLGIQPMIHPKVDDTAFGQPMMNLAKLRENKRQALAQETEANRHNLAYEDILNEKNTIGHQKIEADWNKLEKKDQDKLFGDYNKALVTRDPVAIQAATEELARHGISIDEEASAGIGGQRTDNSTPPLPTTTDAARAGAGAASFARAAMAQALGMPPAQGGPPPEPQVAPPQAPPPEGRPAGAEDAAAVTGRLGIGTAPNPPYASIIADTLGQHKPTPAAAAAPPPEVAPQAPPPPPKRVFKDRNGNVVRTVDSSTLGDQGSVMRILQPMIDATDNADDRKHAEAAAQVAIEATKEMKPKDAMEEGLKIYQTQMGHHKKTGVGGGGGGPAPESQKQIDKDDEFDLKVANKKEDRYKDAVKMRDAANRGLSLLRAGRKSGVFDKVALEEAARTMVGGRVPNQQLDMILNSDGAATSFWNKVNQWFSSGEFDPKFSGDLEEMFNHLAKASTEGINREVSGAEAMLRHHYRNRPKGVADEHVTAGKAYMGATHEGEAAAGAPAQAAPAAPTKSGDDRINEWLKKQGGK